MLSGDTVAGGTGSSIFFSELSTSQRTYLRSPPMTFRDAIALTCCFLTTNALATSFNCSKAHSKTEKLTCSDPELGRLDDLLAASYKRALITHPLPNYLKARQREWVSNVDACGNQSFKGGSESLVKPCMKKAYEDQIGYLGNADKMIVFSNSSHFSYEGADLVAEYFQSNGVWHLSVWGGFVEHHQLSKDAGRAVYMGCTFDGTMTTPSSGKATSSDGHTIHYRLGPGTFFLPPDTDICEGFGRLPDEALKQVAR